MRGKCSAALLNPAYLLGLVLLLGCGGEWRDRWNEIEVDTLGGVARWRLGNPQEAQVRAFNADAAMRRVEEAELCFGCNVGVERALLKKLEDGDPYEVWKWTRQEGNSQLGAATTYRLYLSPRKSGLGVLGIIYKDRVAPEPPGIVY